MATLILVEHFNDRLLGVLKKLLDAMTLITTLSSLITWLLGECMLFLCF